MWKVLVLIRAALVVLYYAPIPSAVKENHRPLNLAPIEWNKPPGFFNKPGASLKKVSQLNSERLTEKMALAINQKKLTESNRKAYGNGNCLNFELAQSTRKSPSKKKSSRLKSKSLYFRSLAPTPGTAQLVIFSEQEFTGLVKDALKNPRVSRALSTEDLLLLSALQNNNPEACREWSKYFFENYPLRDSYQRQGSPKFWSNNIKRIFRRFCMKHKSHANELVNQIVIRNHPFLSKVAAFNFDIDAFLKNSFNLNRFFAPTASRQFNSEWSQAINYAGSLEETRKKIHLLLYQYRTVRSWASPRLRYDCFFLMNVCPTDIARLAVPQIALNRDFYSSMHIFAKKVYLDLPRDSATKALNGVLPQGLAKMYCKSYNSVIRIYANSREEPLEPLL